MNLGTKLFDEAHESTTQRKLREMVAHKLIKYEKLNQDKNEQSYLVIPKKDLPHQLTAYDVAYVANYLNVGLTVQSDELRIYFNENPTKFVDDYRIDKTFKFQSQLKAYRSCTKAFHTIKFALIFAGILLLWFIATAFLDGILARFTLGVTFCAGLLLFFAIVNIGFYKLTKIRILNNLRKILKQNKIN